MQMPLHFKVLHQKEMHARKHKYKPENTAASGQQHQ